MKPFSAKPYQSVFNTNVITNIS